MANELQVKRGTTARSALHLPLDGEPLWDNELKQLFMGDGITLNGIPIGGSQTMEVVVADSGAHNLAADLDATDFTGQLGLATSFIPMFAGDVLKIDYAGDTYTYIGVTRNLGVGGAATAATDYSHHDNIRTGNMIAISQIAMNAQGYDLGDNVIITGFTTDGQAILGYEAAAAAAYTDSCNNAIDQNVHAGGGTGPWVLVCSITLAQDVVAGEIIKAFWEISSDERGGKDGDFDIGYGVDGVAGGLVEHNQIVGPGEKVIYSGSSLVASTGFLTGQTLDLFIRGTGSNANFDLWMANAVSSSKFLINVGSTAAGATTPTASVQGGSFTVSDAEGFDHYYAVTAAAAVVTVPAGLPQGYRFSVRCMADTTFVTTGVTINTPTSMNPLPFETGAVIGFVAIAVDTFDMFGDLDLI